MLSMETSRHLSIDMVFDRLILKNNLNMLSPLKQEWDFL